MNTKTKILLALLLLATVSLGYLRDFIFVSINEITGQGPSGTGGLFVWKWPLTFAFALLYLGITSSVLHLLFAKKKYITITLLVYFLLFLVSFFVAGTGFLFSSFEKVYPFIRTVMGIAQSPIILMILAFAALCDNYFIVKKKDN